MKARFGLVTCGPAAEFVTELSFAIWPALAKNDPLNGAHPL
jgi:hypothetical protein